MTTPVRNTKVGTLLKGMEIAQTSAISGAPVKVGYQ